MKLSGRQPHSSGPRHRDAPGQLCCLRSTGVQLGGGESRRKQRFARIATQVDSARSQPQVIEFHGGQGRNRTADASLFRATLCCTLNNLTDSRWPPKSLRRRERHANRGLELWVQNQPRNQAYFTVTGRLKPNSSTSRHSYSSRSWRREDLRLQGSTGPKTGG